MALFGAWQSERFARVEKLRGFGHYLKELKKQPSGPASRRQQTDEMLAAFASMAASGRPIAMELVDAPPRPSHPAGGDA